jgi:succinoglycan biosynthesis transport protein ExoP
MSTDIALPEPQPAQFSFKDFGQALQLRGWLLSILAVLFIGTALTIALALPPEYRATGTILIEQQEVPQDLVRSTVTANADQRLQVINQRVMTQSNLLGIVREYQLYPDRQNKDTREELVKRMREDISLRMINADVIDPRTGSPRQATIAFTVSYNNRSPEHAVKVANELMSLYLAENLTERQRLAGNTTNFLIDEGERLKRQIAGTEARLATFKLEHADAMPELATMNRNLLDRTEQDLRASEMRSSVLDQQRMFIESQLSQVKPSSMLTTDSGERVLSADDRLRIARSRLTSVRATYAPGHPDIARLEREVKGLETEVGKNASTGPSVNQLTRDLEGARGELAAARDRYAADHPDVQKLERRVSALEKDLADAQSRPAAPAVPAETPDNPTYISLQTQLSAVLNEQAALKKRMDDLRKQMTGYERQIAISPQIEKEYRELARDFETASNEYREVRGKLMEAQMAQNLEAERKGERFTVIEPPLPPEKPVSPNRPAIMVIGVILALVVSLAVVVVLEMMDTSVRGRKDLIALVRTPPLAVLPWIETAAERVARARRKRYAFIGAATTVVFTAGIIHFFVLPLNYVWGGLLRRLGVL